MSKLYLQSLFLGFALILTGCEGNTEDPVVPSGVTDPKELTQHALQKQEIGAFKEAIEILNKAVKIDPKFVPAYYRMGSVYGEWDRRKEAINAYQQVLKRLQKPGAAMKSTLPPEAVLKRVIHALESRKPKIRYYVTTPTYVVGFLRRILSYRALDRILIKSSSGGKR